MKTLLSMVTDSSDIYYNRENVLHFYCIFFILSGNQDNINLGYVLFWTRLDISHRSFLLLNYNSIDLQWGKCC